MNLAKKKDLAARVLGVGKGRIYFAEESLGEIKEAITRQDMLELHKAGAIQIKEVSGRKKIVKRKHRRRTGKIKKKVNNTKQEYVIMTRKSRAHLKHLKKHGKIEIEDYRDARNLIRAKKYKSKRHMIESLAREE